MAASCFAGKVLNKDRARGSRQGNRNNGKNKKLRGHAMDAKQSGQRRCQGADPKPQEDETGRKDFSDDENRAENGPDDPEVVFHCSCCPTKLQFVALIGTSYSGKRQAEVCRTTTSRDSSRQTRCSPAARPGAA